MPSAFDKAVFFFFFPIRRHECLVKMLLAGLAQASHTCSKMMLNPFPALFCLRCVHCVCHRYECWRRSCCGMSKPLFALAASHSYYHFLIIVFFFFLFCWEGHDASRGVLGCELLRSFICVESPCFPGIWPIAIGCSRMWQRCPQTERSMSRRIWRTEGTSVLPPYLWW